MQLTNNTIFITGGTSGIGRGLAEALHKLGNQVIIAGRRKHLLDEVTAANTGMQSLELNMEDPTSIQQAAAHLHSAFPALNVLINNAGIMRFDDLTTGIDEAHLVSTVTTNLLGPIRLTAALIGQLKAQPSSTVINVSSGLAFVPLAPTAVYCATKAGLHSYSQSLRYQLRETGVKVLELIPPYVATDLATGRDDPRAMPLDTFIQQTMAILATDAEEICVPNVMPLRTAAASGKESIIFKGMNDGWGSASN